MIKIVCMSVCVSVCVCALGTGSIHPRACFLVDGTPAHTSYNQGWAHPLDKTSANNHFRANSLVIYTATKTRTPPCPYTLAGSIKLQSAWTIMGARNTPFSLSVNYFWLQNKIWFNIKRLVDSSDWRTSCSMQACVILWSSASAVTSCQVWSFSFLMPSVAL